MNQPKLLDVEVSQAQREAEIYTSMHAFIKLKQHELDAQGALVLEKMKGSQQAKLTFKDEFGTRHSFEIADSVERLRYTKKD
jgi:hypothetical protein